MAPFPSFALIAGQTHAAHMSIKAQSLIRIRVVITAENGLADLLVYFAIISVCAIFVQLERLLRLLLHFFYRNLLELILIGTIGILHKDRSDGRVLVFNFVRVKLVSTRLCCTCLLAH